MLNLQNHYIFYTYGTFQLELTTFQEFSSHTWLVATGVDNTVLKFLLCVNAASLFPQVGYLQSMKPSKPEVFFVGVFLNYQLNFFDSCWTIHVTSFDSLCISRSWSISSKLLNLWT